MKEKNIQGVFSLENLMKRQLAALVHCVRRTALMRVTDMTGTMTKRIAGGIINASIIMKNMPCHNRKHSRYGKNKKELLVILSLKDDKGEQRYCQVAPRCLYLDDYKNLMETMYLSSIPNVREDLLKAKTASNEDFVSEDEVEW